MLVVVGTAGPAFAAGSGYTPGGNPSPGGTATGLPGTVITSTAVQPTGGTVSATVGTASISVDVPAGTFTSATQLVVTDATSSAVTPSSGSVVVTFGVGFFVNGTKVSGSFPSVTVTVSVPGAASGDTVYLVSGGALSPVSGASVSSGAVTFTITEDPVIELVSAPGGATAGTGAIAGGSTVQTGRPVVGQLAGAFLLLLVGGVLLAVRRLRRPVA
jgi:hypothetical protein